MTVALEELIVIAQDDDGNAIEGALVTVSHRHDEDFDAWADEGASTPAVNPARTDSNGTVGFWLPRGPYAYVIQTDDGWTSQPQAWDSMPGSDGAVDLAALAPEVQGAISGAIPFEYSVSTPTTSVTVPHNLGRRPSSVLAYDPTDRECDVGVRVVDLNNVEVTATAPFSGRIEVL